MDHSAERLSYSTFFSPDIFFLSCYNIKPVTVTVEVCDCDTAFAKLSNDANVTCFEDDGFSRWGWTNYIESEGSITMPLYAGNSGLVCNEPSDANLAGIATINYSGGNVSVVYALDGYVMTSAHVYIGCNPYPVKNNKETVAPGQYTYSSGSLNNVSGATINFSGIEGAFNIIVHAVVCEGGPGISGPTSNGNVASGCGISSSQPVTETSENISTAAKSTLDFKAYPVPFNDVLNVEYKYEYDTNVKIQIFDTKGMLILSETDTNYRKGELKTRAINMARVADQSLIVRLSTNREISSKLVVAKSIKRK